MDTMQTVLENAARGKDFDLLLGDFLDEFYRADQETRQSMIDGRPGEQSSETHLSFAAATAHKLANDYGLVVPDWVFEKRCYAAGSVFGCGARGNLRLLFMYQSPPEFKHRNLFVDRNVLSRV